MQMNILNVLIRFQGIFDWCLSEQEFIFVGNENVNNKTECRIRGSRR